MRVAVFEFTHFDLEEKINKWLAANEDKEIVKILQSNQKDLKVTVSIWYK
jgi:hypothetical protein